jgi:acid phosphatase
MKIITFILSLLLGQLACAQDQLIFAIDVVRHGDRTPIQDIHIPPYPWPQSPGQLTPTGMQQAYDLGKKFRALYVNHYHLLPPTYTDNSIYVYSTNYERTIMSASFLLQGLYPKNTIPIHTDSVLFTHLPNPDRLQLLNQTVFSQPAWLTQEKMLTPNFATWSQAMGLNIKTPLDLIIIGDALYVRRLHHIPINLSTKEVSTIITASFSILAQLYQPHQMGHDVAHHLLVQIDKYLLSASQSNTHLKYVLFSAHDITILGLMSDLYTPLSGQVPYVADLKFMLFKTPSDHYQVKVTYNGSPVSIPGCDHNACSLEQFTAIDN